MSDSRGGGMSRAELEERLSVLSRCAMEIAMGNFDVAIPLPTREDELTEVSAALELMRQDLQRTFDELAVAKQRHAAGEQAALEALERERTISAQRAMIQQLSAPVIQVWDSILLLPLVGAVDEARAQQVLENLLAAIAGTQARVVIMDVTGVPSVETTVASHLIKTASAASLLGAEMILCGVSPANAQALAKLGIVLDELHMKRSLQDGLQAAFALAK